MKSASSPAVAMRQAASCPVRFRLSVLSEQEIFLEGRVLVLVGDITRQNVDAVVNAANSTLMGGGGVDGAIHSAGGPDIIEDCKRLRRTHYPNGLPTGKAVITTAGALPARYVIHTVGPKYGQHDGREAELLASCYKNSLTLAANHSLTTIAFPSISTGAFGYPQAEAAAVASKAIEEFIFGRTEPTEVRLVSFDAMTQPSSRIINCSQVE